MFKWFCPMCGMVNYEQADREKLLCRNGNCGEEFLSYLISKYNSKTGYPIENSNEPLTPNQEEG